MGARHKLNGSAVNGIVIVAGLIALVTGSGTVFGIAVVVLFVTSVIAGDIRLSSRR